MFLLEAMAAGCGVVATPVGAVADLLSGTGPEPGALVPVDDARALADALVTALDRDVAWRRGPAARALVAERYGNDVVLARMIEIWREVAEGTGR